MNTAEAVIDFIHKLKITIGKDAGKPFALRDWQCEFIRDIYREEVRDGRVIRPVRTGILSGARKIGKSTLSAALGLSHLIGPVSERNGEIILAANSRDQAKVIYAEVVRMVRMDPYLQELITLQESTNRAFVKRSDVPFAGSTIRVISADAHTAHGLNPSVVIVDELGQAKTRDLFEALTTAQGARENPLLVTISTQNGDPSHFFSEMVEDGINANDAAIVCHLFTADEDCDLLDEDQWKKANPALGDFCSLDLYRDKAREAARLPAAEQSFRKYFLNQKVSLQSSFVQARDWKEAAGPATWEEGEEIVLALDMSATTDLTALVGVSTHEKATTQSWFWKPADYINEHTKRDRFRYDIHAQNGKLFTSEGRIVSAKDVAEFIYELSQRYKIAALVFDPWRKDEILSRLADLDCHLPLVEFRQGYVSMSPAVDAMERALLTNTLEHNDHPIQNFCVLNAVVTMDPAGNRKIDKSKVRQRIDGAVALAMALRERDRFVEEDVPITNPYDDDDNFSLLSL